MVNKVELRFHDVSILIESTDESTETIYKRAVEKFDKLIWERMKAEMVFNPEYASGSELPEEKKTIVLTHESAQPSRNMYA